MNLINETNGGRQYPKVSIIIAAYNAAEYLEIALRSALVQTIDHIEIIIVDDNSHDKTWEIAQTYEASDARVRAVRMEKNSGQYVAMNHAFGIAKGEWIAILDSDDWFAPDRLKNMIAAAETAKINIVADNLFLYDNVAKSITGITFPHWRASGLISLDTFLMRSNPALYALSDYGVIKPVFRRALLQSAQLMYCETRNGADYYFILLALMSAEKLLLLSDAYYYYVTPIGALSNHTSHSSRKRYNFLSFKATSDIFLKNHGASLKQNHFKILDRRGKIFVELDRFEKFREAFIKSDYKNALNFFLESPFEQFWIVFLRAWRFTKNRLMHWF